ncbi:hypothetical protein GF360_00595 [candidate division WWE3 bacterium]|nr:hypothetical protein [candidate division WWE3 bacterium]
MGIYSLKTTLEREEIGLGSFLNPKHTRGIGRPTEKRASAEDVEKKQVQLSPEAKTRFKTTATGTLLEIHQQHGGKPQEQRRQALEIRKQLGEYLGPEELKEVAAGAALLLAIQQTEDYSGYLEEKAGIVLTGKFAYKAELKTEEGSQMQVQNLSTEEEPTLQITLGDELFNATTGEPNANLGEKIERALREAEITPRT